ncbi:MAG TPA: hypothetical protein VK483_03535 [Chitinophagaceae bacterium]|nr:hypothetical protein [Chitinophagaceae bacterium]
MKFYPPRFCAALLLIFATMVIFNSCKKEVKQETLQDTMAANKGTIDKVNAWLNNEKSKATKDRPAKIQSLQDNLVFSDLRFEELNSGERLILIPVGKYFKSVNNKDNNPFNYLLLILDKTNNIRKGNIVQYVTPDGKTATAVPANTFYKFYNLKTLGCDGKFTFLTITDDLLYEMKYEKGSLKTYSEINQKQKASGKGNGTHELQCYTVWWVTFSEYGTNWEFLYAYCDEGECQETRQVSGKGFALNCGGDPGPETEIAVAAQRDWIVAQNSFGYWLVYSTESFTGIKKASESGGGHFTGISHLSSGIIGTGFTWAASGCTVSHTTSTATSIIGGTGTFTPTQFQFFISSTPGTFSFSQIFP